MDYITDTGGGEMDQSQNGEVIIGPQLESAMAAQDADMKEDEARSEATFRFTVPNFSKLKVRLLSSINKELRINLFLKIFARNLRCHLRLLCAICRGKLW